MPVYEYRNHHTGEIELHLRSVAQRDSVPPHLKRIQVPSGVGICGLACPPSQSSQVMQGFKECEEKFGMNAIARETGMSARKIKEVWTEGWHPEERKTKHQKPNTNEQPTKAAA